MRRILQARLVLVTLLVLSLTLVGAWAGDVAGEISNENTEAIGNGDGNIWVIPALSSPSVKNGGKLTIQTLVKAAAGVHEVRAEILDGDRVLDSLVLKTKSSGAGGLKSTGGLPVSQVGIAEPVAAQGDQTGIWFADWTAHGLEEKYYTIRLTVKDRSGNSFTDETLQFSDPVVGILTPGTTAYHAAGMRRVSAANTTPDGELHGAVIDTANGYAYFGTSASPVARVIKVALGAAGDPPVRIGAVDLNSGEWGIQCGVIDAANGYAYFGTISAPARIIKVALGVGDAPPTRVGSMVLASGEDGAKSAVIDTANGYAYFGTMTDPGRVVKVALGAGNAVPTRVGAVTLNAGEADLTTGVIDAANGYAYWGTNTEPGRIVKIALGAGSALPTRIGVLTLGVGSLNFLNCSVIDPANGYAYFGTRTGTTASVVKVELGVGDAVPTLVGSLVFFGIFSGEYNFSSAVIDTSSGYAYFGTATATARIIKVALGVGNALPTRVGAVTVPDVEEFIGAIIDPAQGYAYFVTEDPVGKIAKVTLGVGAAVPALTATVTLFGGESTFTDGVIDEANGYAYFGTAESPARVIKFKLGPGESPPERVGSITMADEDNYIRSGVIDSANGYAYFGVGNNPGRILKVALGAGSAPPVRVASLTLDALEHFPTSAVIDTANGYAYFGTNTNPGRIVKVALGDGTDPPTRINALTLNVGEDDATYGVIDPENGYAYFVLQTNPASIVKVALGAGGSAPTRIGSAIFNTGEANPRCMVLDKSRGYVYVGLDGLYGKVIKVAVGTGANPPSRVAGFEFGSGGGGLQTAVIDQEAGIAYFGNDTNPAKIIKIDLGENDAAPTLLGKLFLNDEEEDLISSVIDVANGYAYFGSNTNPARLVKVQLSQKGYLKGTKIAVPETADATSVSFYAHKAVGNARFAIYGNAAPRPLLWQSGPIAITASEAWTSVAINSGTPSSLQLPGGEYQLTWQIDSGANVPSYNSGWPAEGLFEVRPFGPAPAQLDPLSPTITNERWSMYLTYDGPEPMNNAVFHSDQIPAQLADDQALPFTVSFTNTGNTTWNPGSPYTLAVISDACSLVPALRMPLINAAPVKPGEIGVFAETFSLPPATESCHIEFQMVEELVEFFGATHSLNIPIVAGMNDAQFVSAAIPASVPINSGRYISFVVRNLGSKAWFTGSNHALKVISDACGLFGQGSYAAEGDGVTLTNQNRTFMTFIQTPASDGACAFQLQMTETGVGDFGPVFDGVLNVATPPNTVRGWANYE